MTEPARLADRVFAAELASLAEEAKLSDAMDEIVPGDAWEHVTTDWYDRSVEVYLYAAPSDPDRIASALFAHGFRLVWVHPHISAAREVGGALCRCPVRGAPREAQQGREVSS